MGNFGFCSRLLVLLAMSAVEASSDAGYFDGLYNGYNVSHYLITTGKLKNAGSPGQGRSFSRKPKRRAFSVGIFGVPDGTTLRFQLQVVRPFASEYTDFLNADLFNTEWYMSLRYKVSDLQATFFRKFQGPGRVNMTAAYQMMDTTTQMLQNMTTTAAAAADYEATSDGTTSYMTAPGATNRVHDYHTGQQYDGYSEYSWGAAGTDGYGQQQDGYGVPFGGYVNRQGEIDNRVGVEPDSELFDAQNFRLEQKMKIYERMQQMYSRQGQDGAECVLRAICEVAEAPMEDGVLGDVVNLLLSATSGIEDLLHEKTLDKRFRQYLEAHMYGEMRGGCGQRYGGCTLSVLDPTALALF